MSLWCLSSGHPEHNKGKRDELLTICQTESWIFGGQEISRCVLHIIALFSQCECVLGFLASTTCPYCLNGIFLEAPLLLSQCLSFLLFIVSSKIDDHDKSAEDSLNCLMTCQAFSRNVRGNRMNLSSIHQENIEHMERFLAIILIQQNDSREPCRITC